MANTKKVEGCVWALGTPCSGEVKETMFFKGQIKVPVCESHVDEHRIIIMLFNNGYDVEEILNQTADWRKQEALTIQLSGLAKLDDVEL